MAVSPHRLESEELLCKAQTVVQNIEATKYQKEVLTAVLNRFMWHLSDIESTNRWAQQAFDENKRLMQLIRDRWEAGWQGNKEEVEVTADG
jgi:hypothetical protein